MPRYIDADALLKKSGWYNLYGGNKSIRAVRVDEITCMPTADVAEVRHGRWRWCGLDSFSDCSECLVCNGISDNESNYCPNCGAKMEDKP